MFQVIPVTTGQLVKGKPYPTQWGDRSVGRSRVKVQSV